MQLELYRTMATVADFNPRAEMHGNEAQPAGDIKLELALGLDALAMFGPNLRHALYDEANGSVALRNPRLKGPLGWLDDVKEATVTLHDAVVDEPGTESLHRDLTLGQCKVNAITLEPRDGGTTEVCLRVQCHPDEEQAGRLCALIAHDIEISVAAEQKELPL